MFRRVLAALLVLAAAAALLIVVWPPAIATLGIHSGADIVSLPETTKTTADAVAALMTSAGLPSEFAYWESDLHWLARTCGASDTIMTGDFNATLDHLVGLGAAGGQSLGR